VSRLICLAFVLAACGDNLSSATPWILDTVEPSDGFWVRTPEFPVAASAEIQDCYFFQVPDVANGADLWVDHTTLALNPGSHHMNVFRVKTIVNLDPSTAVPVDMGGVQGAVIQMVSHGLVAGGLFLMVGMIYERCHTRELAAYGGLAKLLPVYSVFFMVLTLASVGLPTTSGFTGEFLVLLGAFKAAWPLHVAGNELPLVLAVVAVAGVVLGALYMLRFALGFLYGAAQAPNQPLADLGGREKTILGLIVVAVFALGLFPDEPMKKTELAAQAYRQLVTTSRLPVGSKP